MRQVAYLLIGQGICGTFLSWYLSQSGVAFHVIDQPDPSSASRVAAGVINPVTGRRIVKTWMIDTLLPFALDAYQRIGTDLDVEAIVQKNIVDFFPSAQMRVAFRDRINEDPQYLTLHEDDHRFSGHFNYVFGSGEIAPCYVAQLQALLPSWRNRLSAQDLITEETFDETHLRVSDSEIRYKDIVARKLIYCDGVSSAQHRYFKNLPFAINKGESLIVRIPGLPSENIYKKATTVVPLGDELFWVGSSHEWNYQDMLPTSDFYSKTRKQLQQWLKVPFTVEGHLAAARPATVERRPFVGLHPHVPSVGILNGMGTKGCSLAPYFAKQLADQLTKNSSILPEANVSRFTRILQTQQ